MFKQLSKILKKYGRIVFAYDEREGFAVWFPVDSPLRTSRGKTLDDAIDNLILQAEKNCPPNATKLPVFTYICDGEEGCMAITGPGPCMYKVIRGGKVICEHPKAEGNKSDKS